MGLANIPITDEYPEKYDRLLCGGIWCIVQLDYETEGDNNFGIIDADGNTLQSKQKKQKDIGWKDMGDLSLIQADRDAFKEKYTEVYPDAKKGSIANGAGMLYRFTHEVGIGDYVVFPSKIDRQINIGVVEGGYEYHPEAAEYAQQHKVKWLKHLPRTSFSQGALYEVG